MLFYICTTASQNEVNGFHSNYLFIYLFAFFFGTIKKLRFDIRSNQTVYLFNKLERYLGQFHEDILKTNKSLILILRWMYYFSMGL